jgi:N-carbamoyl-L-amino-acid hydrolase
VTTAELAFGRSILERADHLAQWSESESGLTCTYLSSAHRAVAAQLVDWMRAAGLEVTTDALGNVTGRYAATDPKAKTLILGSHYDTVRNAGKYDGRLGILLPLAIVERLAQDGRRLPFHIDIVAFAEEEGVRFTTGLLASSALVGAFDTGLLSRADQNGVTLAAALQEAGLDPNAIPSLRRRPEDLLGYLEVHIEQGPVLLEEGLPVGIVSAIAGSVRHQVTVTGFAGHAGTVPMGHRRDAAAAAAEIVLAVERRCSTAPGLVGTVGQLTVPNGAPNVIPARCDLSLDIRAGEDALRDAAIADVLAEIDAIARRRNVAIAVNQKSRMPAVACSLKIQEALAAAIGRAGLPVRHLPSGAGHDAGMLFVRCGNGGISHNPDETVTADDVEIAARVLLDTVTNFPAR